MSAHPTWRDVLTDGILAERHGADLLFGSAAVRALETAAYRALAPFTLMARTNTLGATDPKLVQAMRKLLGALR
ncbi:hypothetical protein ACQCR9_07385 [Ralstonia pseudosolanacearum]|uniref:hypothetical protein n=1 Tax=Ralstonia pseudosolanacearum TaxID=1310165 RepID=UPI003CF71705